MADFIFVVPEITIKPRVFKEISSVDNQLGGKKNITNRYKCMLNSLWVHIDENDMFATDNDIVHENTKC